MHTNSVCVLTIKEAKSRKENFFSTREQCGSEKPGGAVLESLLASLLLEVKGAGCAGQAAPAYLRAGKKTM